MNSFESKYHYFDNYARLFVRSIYLKGQLHCVHVGIGLYKAIYSMIITGLTGVIFCLSPILNSSIIAALLSVHVITLSAMQIGILLM